MQSSAVFQEHILRLLEEFRRSQAPETAERSCLVFGAMPLEESTAVLPGTYRVELSSERRGVSVRFWRADVIFDGKEWIWRDRQTPSFDGVSGKVRLLIFSYRTMAKWTTGFPWLERITPRAEAGRAGATA